MTNSIYPVLVAPARGAPYVRMQDAPGITNMSREPRINGWLGTTDNVPRTALGEFTTRAAANRAAREALNYRPRCGRYNSYTGIFQ